MIEYYILNIHRTDYGKTTEIYHDYCTLNVLSIIFFSGDVLTCGITLDMKVMAKYGFGSMRLD